ncbi:MAG: Asp-tRNA(Asn)/Glu-tRNA(Gln) amidotransferase subunit GatC [Bacteroidales bacterium]
MKIDDKLIDRLSSLARLEFKDKERENIRNDLEKIFNFVEKLKEVDTGNVEPLIFMSDEFNVLRDDIVEQTITREEALKNAPDTDGEHFRVPKVIKK